METLKDKKIAKLEELVKDLAPLINSDDAIAVGLKDRLSDLAALSEQPDTAPTVRDELIKSIAVNFFYWWWNAGGTNTADAFDDWWKNHKQEYLSAKV